MDSSTQVLDSKEKTESCFESKGQAGSHFYCNTSCQQKFLDIDYTLKCEIERRRKSSNVKTEEHQRHIDQKDNSIKFHSHSNQYMNLELVPKRLLKTCRWCHFKKRSCAFTRLNCTAFLKNCNSCKSWGIFQSQ